jgi:ATP-dependent Lhr-like helicase
MSDPLHAHFHSSVGEWFRSAFPSVTEPQRRGWPPIARGESTLILAPTGSGKTLAAFLWSLNRLMFEPVPDAGARCRVVYISPLKALAVDIERNLQAPLDGIARAAGSAKVEFHHPAVAVRTGDTPASERARFVRAPADILITTPESLFLLLTSRARERLRSVDTVIVDEIHALVPTKRGAHLALSLERLEHLTGHKLQRLGLSATQRPLDEVARFLGGKRPVTIVNAGTLKALDLRVQVPLEAMTPGPPPRVSRRGGVGVTPGGRDSEASSTDTREAPSIWTAIHPVLVSLVREHRSTLIFVNNRRLCERLAAALNDVAGEPLVRAHHGSLAREQRAEVEELLKAGRLRGLVATSSLELGIDMGAIDLVVQIEAPPSVASGLQRIGRAGHRLDAVSTGVIVPKFRGDLVATAAVVSHMLHGQVEASRYPRNPLDVLAQQIVAMAAMDRWKVDELFRVVRRAAPFAELGRPMFDGILDMLSGRYPSDEFAELRPRVTWDRVNGTLVARQGAGRVAITNAGTIPDRGLYGVFLSGGTRHARVGELDEEMVFESRVGDRIVLGATTWRIDEITHDRVLVSPSPGEPGRLPFWKGEGPGRPVELGFAIGQLVRELVHMPRRARLTTLERDHRLDPHAATALVDYLAEQQQASGVVPDDRTILIEQTRDDLGDWRLALLSPLGGRVHAPWAMAAVARIHEDTGLDVDVMWGNEGFVVRYPEGDRPPDPSLLVPDPDQVERLVVAQLSSTALFAARFREAAARALLLPRRRPGARAPLWQRRKRATMLLSVASRFGSFPIILETYRELLRDVFDLPALADVLMRVRKRSLRVVTTVADRPSPFGASLLFNYVANYIYDGDAPPAERRAQALALDHAQLRDLIGDAALRELIDPAALAEVEEELQRLAPRLRARSEDEVHDLLLRLGDLTGAELDARVAADDTDRSATDDTDDTDRFKRGRAAAATGALSGAQRIIELPIAGEPRWVAVEDAARYRDALGTALPAGLPQALLDPVADPIGDLVRRYARTHGPFTADDVAARFDLDLDKVQAALGELLRAGRVVEGEFRPGGRGREWCDVEVLGSLRRRSLARLRREVEPVEADALGRFLVAWHGLTRPRTGLDGLLDSVEQLQGAPLVASVLETEVLSARVGDYTPAMLDTLLAAGEVTWVGLEPLGDRDGRIALYLTDHAARLRPPAGLPGGRETGGLLKREADLVRHLTARGPSFFADLHDAAGAGFPGETVDALWNLVWKGVVTNDSLQPLRAYTAAPERRRGRGRAAFRSRRLVPPTAEGRWTLTRADSSSATEWAAAQSAQLLSRHGVVTRDAAAIEDLPGGFAGIYPVLKRLEDTGRVRRGYFVAGLGAAQFAQPGALDLLRGSRDAGATPSTVTLSATDPANPYGVSAPWPQMTQMTQRDQALKPSGPQALRPSSPQALPGARTPMRSAGARVVLVDGRMTCWIARGGRALLVALPDDEPERTRVARALAAELVALAYRAPEGRRGWLIEEINSEPAIEHPVWRALCDAGFVGTRYGLQLRVERFPTSPTRPTRPPHDLRARTD